MTNHINERDWIIEYTEVGVRLLLKRALNAKGVPFSQGETADNLLKIASLTGADVDDECAKWAHLAGQWKQEDETFPEKLACLMVRQAAVCANRFYRLQEKEKSPLKENDDHGKNI